MVKRPIRNQIVERLSRLGDASMHQVSDPNEGFAQIYHYHNTLEVIIIRQGWVEGLVGGIIGTMQKDMIAVIGNDVPHRVLQASNDCKVILIHIPSELLKWDEERFPELIHGMEFIRNSKSGMIYHDVDFTSKITRLAGKIASADGFERMSLLMRLLHVLSTTPPESTLKAELHSLRGKKGKESSIDRAYRYIYEHFREQLSLGELAAYSGLNPSALCRSFKKASGYTVGQFCCRLRVEYASNLLLTTNMDVAQIAYQSGYNSYPHFCTQFKNTMKMSPTEYRGGTGILP